MIEPMFVSVPPLWTGMAGNAAAPGLAGPLAPPAGSAPMLVAAVAMRRGQAQGPTNDQEVEEVIYDTLELFSGASDVDVRCEAGRVTLSGTVSHKRLKRDIGEIAWAIPTLSDVANNITIAPRRGRARPFVREREREAEPAVAAGRKQG